MEPPLQLELGSAVTGVEFVVHLLDAICNLGDTNSKSIEKHDILAAFDLHDTLLALSRLNAILVVLLEEAVQTSAMDCDALGIDDAQPPCRSTAVCTVAVLEGWVTRKGPCGCERSR